jgi:hypothetical protein
MSDFVVSCGDSAVSKLAPKKDKTNSIKLYLKTVSNSLLHLFINFNCTI